MSPKTRILSLLWVLMSCRPLSDSALLCQEAEGQALAKGPPCACDSLFPMCVDTSWRYEVIDLSTNVPEPPKVWSFTGLASNLNLSYHDETATLSKFLPSAWSICRSSETEVRQAWLTEQEGAVYWERSWWFSADGRSEKETYYDDRRVRLFNDVPSGTKEDIYTEYTSEREDGDLVSSKSNCSIVWDVVEVPREVTQNPRFAGREVVCEHSKSICTNMDGNAPEEATFCFSPGTGKIWERTEGEVEETLVDWSVPGCSQSPSADR